MILTIDLDELKRVGISPFQFVLMWCIHNNNCTPDYKDPGISDMFEIEQLIDEKYVLPHGENLALTKKAFSLFKQNEIKPKEERVPKGSFNCDELAVKIKELFPKGVKSGDIYPVRSPVKEISEKLIRFFKKYGDNNYTEDEILRATKLYLKDYQAKGWDYISTAKHFIIKIVNQEERSILAQYIERIRNERFEKPDLTDERL